MKRRELLQGGILATLLMLSVATNGFAQNAVQPMPDNEFWRLIDLLGGNAEINKSMYYLDLSDAQINASEANILSFFETLSQKLYALDTQENYEFFSPVPNLSVSFLHARLFVVAGGDGYYLNILDNPSQFPQRSKEYVYFEGLLAMSALSYEWVSGTSTTVTASVSYESFSNSIGWEK